MFLEISQNSQENTCARVSSLSKVFLWKGVLKICSKFTVEHKCRSLISVKLQSNFIEIKLQHGCSPVNLLHIFITYFPKNTSGELLLSNQIKYCFCDNLLETMWKLLSLWIRVVSWWYKFAYSCKIYFPKTFC